MVSGFFAFDLEITDGRESFPTGLGGKVEEPEDTASNNGRKHFLAGTSASGSWEEIAGKESTGIEARIEESSSKIGTTYGD